MMKEVFNNIDFYKKALDGISLRNTIISHNIANVNTPNYKRKLVVFEDQLKEAMEKRQVSMRTTHEKHISNRKASFQPKILEDKSLSYRIDGNNVNIDTETAELAKNQIMYNALINQVIGEFEKIKNVITEGSK